MSETEGLKTRGNMPVMIWIIWASMFSSLIIYIFICHVMGDKIKPFDVAQIPLSLIENILIGMSAIELIAAYFIRKSMLQSSNYTSQLNERYTSIVIISLAISESVGIYGLVLFFLSKDFSMLYTFIAISAVAMIFYRPKIEEFEQIVSDKTPI